MSCILENLILSLSHFLFRGNSLKSKTVEGAEARDKDLEVEKKAEEAEDSLRHLLSTNEDIFYNT